MKIYAETPWFRSRQIAGDVGLLLWVVLWTRLAWRTHELVGRLAGPGAAVERAGEQLAGSSAAGGARVDDLPIVGGALRRPFDAITSGGASLARAGELQQEVAASLALVLAFAVAAVPIVWVATRYGSWRTRLIQEASAAARLRDSGADSGVFALRALANRPLRKLAAISSDPWADFEAGRHAQLARLELEALGLRTAAGSRNAT